MATSKKAIDAISNYLTQANPSTQQISLLGSGAVAELEEKLKVFYNVEFALCVSNATMGLWAIAQALDLAETEFITSPYTYGASLAGFLNLNCKPVFADIDHTLNINPDLVPKLITSQTKAILSVDIFGTPCNQIQLRQIADEHNLFFISDAAQSFGAYRDGIPASRSADAFVVSFTYGKTLFCGEGGAILTNNCEIYRKLLWFSQHPLRQRKEIGLYNEFALNCRINPLAAIWANAVFDESLDSLLLHQTRCFKIIDALNQIGLTEQVSFTDENILPTFFRLSALWKYQFQHAALIKELEAHGLFVSLEPPPVQLIYQQPAFIARYGHNQFNYCPKAESKSKNCFCLSLL